MLKFKMVYKLGLYIHVIKSSEEHFELNRIWSPYQLYIYKVHMPGDLFNNAIDLVFSNHQFDFVLQMEDYQRLFTRLDPRFLLGPDWDIYLMTFLALLLGFIVLLRRVRWHRHYLQEWTIVFLFSLSNLVINEKHIIILYNVYM